MTTSRRFCDPPQFLFEESRATRQPTLQLVPDPRLIVVQREPFNAETPLGEHHGVITPTSLFYVRSNFAVPAIELGAWRLCLDGAVERPLRMPFEHLLALRARTVLATLECAGNGRSFLQPAVDGEPWQYGAISTAAWTGVPLRELLRTVGLTDRVREIAIYGADSGRVAGRESPIPFARSLPLDKVLHEDTLLAYAMNGEPLPPAHGFPLRLIVPGWYGMASVKWVTRVEARTEPFDGYYQSERYVLLGAGENQAAPMPLQTARVRSLITAPTAGATLRRGVHHVHGVAWSGAAPIVRVEVSVDGGRTWATAVCLSAAERYAWRRWTYEWHASHSGAVTLCSRAFDAAGNMQPQAPEWNRLGYANNAIQRIAVTVAP